MSDGHTSESQTTVIIVEDDLLLNKVMCLQLERSGFTVFATTCATQALEKIKEEVPAILVLDVVLPDMNGFELVSELRKNKETAGLPLIVHSSLDLTQEEESLLTLGPTRVVTKSTAYSDHLSELISEVLKETSV